MWQQWLRYIRNFFGFTRGEARGFSVMALLIVMAYAAWFVYRLVPPEPYNPVPDQQQLDSLISLLEKGDTTAPVAGGNFSLQPVPPVQEFFYFNPNTVSQDSLLRLGFPPYLAQRLVNYRAKGGRFRRKEDLLKLYGMQETLFEQLAPWIKLPIEKPNDRDRSSSAPAYAEKGQYTERRKEEKERTSAKFDLNKADSLQLLSVRGIGPVLSGRILKFREGLGGFVRAEQVREVWGLPPEAADALLKRAYIAPDAQHRSLAINTADVSELARHPYISRKQAEGIVAYRSQHGPFHKPEDLLAIHVLDAGFVEKLKPYLQF